MEEEVEINTKANLSNPLDPNYKGPTDVSFFRADYSVNDYSFCVNTHLQ